MERVTNIENIPKEYIDDPDFCSKLKTVCIGDALGSEKIYVNMDYVRPGARSTKYHSHSAQEEFFIIMNGTGILKMNGEEISIKSGDVISKPAGRNIAHQFINSGTEILQILDMGTREKEDIIMYPEENVMYIKNSKAAFKLDSKIEKWSSEPNE